MSEALSEDKSLLTLRSDLKISAGAPFVSGAPGWVIYDPIRHRFFQIGQLTMDILARWSAGTVGGLKNRLWREKRITLEDAKLEEIEKFLIQNQLVERSEKGAAARYAQSRAAQHSPNLWRAAQKLLFLRMPLVRPERFLQATWPVVRPLFSRGFFWLTGFCLVLGISLALRQTTDLAAHFNQAYSWSGAGLFVLAIALVKVFHELGHAYQAVSRGVRVPVMGVAFFAFLPLLYTDISDAWRLRHRHDRILIDLGGILAEITIAVYATLLWCFLPDGAARMVVFSIATSSWVLSLFVNLNPFMRFDGYFLLSDALGVHNLQNRSFALAKWAMRRRLIGLDDPIPERLDPVLHKGLIWYGFGVWAYRFFLFLSIALLIYAMFFKLAGLFLLCVALGAFVIKPIITEVSFWVKARNRIENPRRSLVTVTMFGLLVLAFFWPFATRFQSPAIVDFAVRHAVFPPDAARLEAVIVTEGQWVEKGDKLFQFEDPALPKRVEQSQTRIALFEARLLSAAGDSVERADSQVIQRILEEERESLRASREREQKMTVVASVDGTVRDLLPDLTPGAWYPRDHMLAHIVQPEKVTVRGYISEENRDILDTSAPIRFVPDDPAAPVLTLSDLALSDYAIEHLSEGYFAKDNGGLISTVSGDPGLWTVAGVWYPMSAHPDESGAALTQTQDRVTRGIVSLGRQPQSIAHRVWKRVARVLIRELEF